MSNQFDWIPKMVTKIEFLEKWDDCVCVCVFDSTNGVMIIKSFFAHANRIEPESNEYIICSTAIGICSHPEDFRYVVYAKGFVARRMCLFQFRVNIAVPRTSDAMM